MSELQNVVPNSNQVDINNFQTLIPLLQPPRHLYFLPYHLFELKKITAYRAVEYVDSGMVLELSMLLIVLMIFCARESLRTL